MIFKCFKIIFFCNLPERIYWEYNSGNLEVPFTGVPFVVRSCLTKHCQFGSHYYKTTAERLAVSFRWLPCAAAFRPKKWNTTDAVCILLLYKSARFEPHLHAVSCKTVLWIELLFLLSQACSFWEPADEKLCSTHFCKWAQFFSWALIDSLKSALRILSASFIQILNQSCLCRYDKAYMAGVAKQRLFEPLHAALWAFRKLIYLFFIYVAKCRNIVKWYCGK